MKLTAFLAQLSRLYLPVLGYDVFLSYGRDRPDATPRTNPYVSALLTKLAGPPFNFYCFQDESGLYAGELTREQLERGLRRCRILVVLVNERALRSGWVWWEIETFLASVKPW